jgi:hypothetical protein
MEPLSILGVAANILQLVHFGLKILSKSNEIRKKGASEDNVSIEAVAKHLQESLERVRSYSLPGTSAAQKLRTQCLSVVDELLKAVNDLKIMGQPTRWKSFRNAIKNRSIEGKDRTLDAPAP